MSYTIITLPATTPVNTMTPTELQKIIEGNTVAIAQVNQALNTIVSQFIRPTAQQAVSNFERLERIEAVIEGNATAVAYLNDATEDNQQQIAANTEAITALTDSLRFFDTRLEETRALVAQNGSQIAQLTVKQDRNAEQISELVRESRAFRELQQTQLAAIIGNASRIDRLEQQAS